MSRRRRSYRKKPYGIRKKRTLNVKKIAKRALKEVNKMKKSVEVKYSTQDIAPTIAGSTATWGTAVGLTAISQGTTKITRIGDKITMKNLQCRTVISKNASETANPLIRAVMLIDRKSTATPPTGDIIFDANSIYGNINNTDNTYKGRFQILFDKTFNIPTTIRSKPLQIFIPRKIPFIYASGTITKNNIYWLICTDGTNSHAITWNIRYKLAFTDA